MKTFKKLKNVFNFYKKSKKQVNYYNTLYIRGQFSQKFKKSLKIYLHIHFSRKLLQIFGKCFLYYKKKQFL